MVEKLSGLAGMLHHHSLTKDKFMYLVRDCVEVYLNFNLTVRGLTFTKKAGRELLDQLIGICTNWIQIQEIQRKEYLKFDRSALLSVVLVQIEKHFGARYSIKEILAHKQMEQKKKGQKQGPSFLDRRAQFKLSEAEEKISRKSLQLQIIHRQCLQDGGTTDILSSQSAHTLQVVPTLSKVEAARMEMLESRIRESPYTYSQALRSAQAEADEQKASNVLREAREKRCQQERYIKE
jgi:hypothetical protein